MNPLFGRFLVFCVILFILSGCDQLNEDARNDNNIIGQGFGARNTSNSEEMSLSLDINNYSYSFESVQTPSEIIISTFSVKKEGRLILETFFETAIGNYGYKAAQSALIEIAANNYSRTLDKKSFQKVLIDMEGLMEKMSFGIDESVFLSNQIFYHRSIIQTIVRKLEGGSDECECTAHPGYLVDKIGFICQEDYAIPISVLQSILKEKADILSVEESVFLESFVKSQELKNIKEITFNQLYFSMIDEGAFNRSLEEIAISGKSSRGCWLGQGSSWGCCGNYAGCCYYWNLVCWVHDAICTKCWPRWFCFSGCKPDQ